MLHYVLCQFYFKLLKNKCKRISSVCVFLYNFCLTRLYTIIFNDNALHCLR